MMSLWDALRMNMMISYQELVRTFLSAAVTMMFNIKHLSRVVIAIRKMADKHKRAIVASAWPSGSYE
ncbi:hypothetical protein DOD04_00360 [Klebsiella michiganensis]|nr:hypothetical protein DOD04_00360 [Klebsiella michiganensis]